jgi:hypothetical protein
MLAAAGIAAVFLARRSDLGLPSAPTAAAPAASGASTAPPIVASAAENVAVFTTANPNIVVVWQF